MDEKKPDYEQDPKTDSAAGETPTVESQPPPVELPPGSKGGMRVDFLPPDEPVKGDGDPT